VLTIACVLRSGGIYTAEWVDRLARKVARHAPAHRFVCLSDMDAPCERIPLVHGWPGWWAKIELFRPGMFEGRVLYLDLDVLPVAPLEPLADGQGMIAMKDSRFPGVNSSVMAWDAGDTEIYDRFRPETMARLRSDQDWINEMRPDLATYPPGLAPSYKDHCAYGLPPGASVIVFHGKPKPDSFPATHWVGRRWAEDAA